MGTQTYNQAIEKYGHVSVISLNNEQILDLIRKYSQTGRNVYSRKGIWQKKEVIVDCGQIIGEHDDNGTLIPTRSCMICYSKTKGVHIRPIDPRRYENEYKRVSQKVES